MQAVVAQDDFQTAVALRAAHGKQMHRFVIHAHQHTHAARLVGAHDVGVQRLHTGETGRAQVETVPRMIVVQVGIEAQEARHAHQKHQVEVGHRRAGAVEPLQGVAQVGKERSVRRFLMERMVQKLGQKQRDGRLVGVVGQGRKQAQRSHVLQPLQVQARPEVRFVGQHRQRLEQHAPRWTLSGARQFDEVGHPPLLFGEDVGNHRRIVVFYGAQHDAGRMLEHGHVVPSLQFLRWANLRHFICFDMHSASCAGEYPRV